MEEKDKEQDLREEEFFESSSSGDEITPNDLMAMWEETLKEAKLEEQKKSDNSEDLKKDSHQPAKLEELSPEKKTGVYPELEFILDIPLEISVEIGRTKMLIRDLLKLNQGSIIELEKFAGEPVEIYVNGKLMAKGEVVVVNDKFGVRITEIISAQERVKKLGS